MDIIKYLGINSSDLTFSEIDLLRPDVYRKLASEKDEISFIKTHDAWKTNDEGDTENLFYKYGEGIIGLTNENLEKLGQEILRRFSKGVRDYFKI